MNLNGPKAKLSKTTKDVILQWQQTENHWRDQKAREFGQKYLAGLQDQVNGAMSVIEDLERVLNKIQKDCE